MTIMSEIQPVYLRVPKSLHKKLKHMAVEEERSMQSVYISALRAYAEMPHAAAPKAKSDG